VKFRLQAQSRKIARLRLNHFKLLKAIFLEKDQISRHWLPQYCFFESNTVLLPPTCVSSAEEPAAADRNGRTKCHSSVTGMPTPVHNYLEWRSTQATVEDEICGICKAKDRMQLPNAHQWWGKLCTNQGLTPFVRRASALSGET
jgi:hypothetical protein